MCLAHLSWPHLTGGDENESPCAAEAIEFRLLEPTYFEGNDRLIIYGPRAGPKGLEGLRSGTMRSSSRIATFHSRNPVPRAMAAGSRRQVCSAHVAHVARSCRAPRRPCWCSAASTTRAQREHGAPQLRLQARGHQDRGHVVLAGQRLSSVGHRSL